MIPKNTQSTTVYSQPTGDLVTSVTRTATPAGVGVVVAVLLDQFNIVDTKGNIKLILAYVVGQAYYIGVRLLERAESTSSKWGWLLGAAKPPVYAAGSQTDIVATVETPEAPPVVQDPPVQG